MNVKMALGEIKIRKEYDIKKIESKKESIFKEEKNRCCVVQKRELQMSWK